MTQTNIILSTTDVDEEDAVELVGLKIVTQDEEWLGFYDRLQVFRSTQGAGGPYEELTAASWKVPRLPKGAGDEPATLVTGPLINIVGKTLTLIANNVVVDVTFTGSDPLTFAQVATQITLQGGNRVSAYVDVEGGLVIESTYPGLISSLEITDTEAATILGLPTTEPDNKAQGADARPALVPLKFNYDLVDYFGSSSYFYRTRYIHTLTGAQSPSSAAFSSAVGVVATSIVGFVALIDQTGKALMGQEVRTFTDFTGLPVVTEGSVVTGGTQVRHTNRQGYVEFQLIRGQKVTVSIQGTDVVRTITVPTDQTLQKFNLLDPDISDADIFKAVVPTIITAERRSL